MRFKWLETTVGCVGGEPPNYEAKLSDKTFMHITRTTTRDQIQAWNVHFEPDKQGKAMQFVGLFYELEDAKRGARKWFNEYGFVL